MPLPSNKTKIVCTVGPASDSLPILEQMVRAGADVFRLNFSHGDFSTHAESIDRIRRASRTVGKRVAILADLPGPKIRLGRLTQEPLELERGDLFTLTTEENERTKEKAFVDFALLPQVVAPGDQLLLKDGMVQLRVLDVVDQDIECEVVAGGELRSYQGLNIPGIDLGTGSFTERDRACLEFALGQGVDAVGLSFVESGAEVSAARAAAAALGFEPFVIAKIERRRALDRIDEILEAADGVMLARGDLGVEIPIERIAVVQKQVIRQANRRGKPVITATQMLESMTNSPRPTRAEATDVANAILDGTDAVMLSGESAVGKFPVDAVRMLSSIAAAVEPSLSDHPLLGELRSNIAFGDLALPELITLCVANTLQRIRVAAVIVPTRGGSTARKISEFRLPTWITSVSSSEKTCNDLIFSYGVFPVYEPDHPTDWSPWIRSWLRLHEIPEGLVILTEGPSRRHPGRSHRMEIFDLKPTHQPNHHRPF